MFAALILAASMGMTEPEKAVVPDTNAVQRVVGRRKRPEPKPIDKLTPVEAWHKFCRSDGKVAIPKDTRPKPYRKEKPNPHKRKPRK